MEFAWGDALFYGMSFVTVCCAMGALLMQNVVHGVLCLIGAFFNAAGLFVLLNAEFLAFVMVIVYVGAVALLFLFILMTFRIQDNKERQISFYKKPVFYGGLILLSEMIFFIEGHLQGFRSGFLSIPETGAGNTHLIGRVLYTHYFLPLQLLGVILLVAMIVSIVLLWYEDNRVRKQKIKNQVGVQAKNRLTLHDVPSKKGISF